MSVYLVSQMKFPNDGNYIQILDDGVEALQEYTLDEFSGLEGLDIVVDSISHASGYMFAANVEDRSSLKFDLTDSGLDSNVLMSHTISYT